MSKHEITGLGPVNTITGTMKIFTHLPKAFEVTTAWLETNTPEVGQFIEVDSLGALHLINDPTSELTPITETKEYSDGTIVTAPGPLPDLSPAQQEATEKKSTDTGSAIGSELSPFREYQAKPNSVHAAEITEVGELEDGKTEVVLTDGTRKAIGDVTHSDYHPVAGDYWVIGYGHDGITECILPAAAFHETFELLAGA